MFNGQFFMHNSLCSGSAFRIWIIIPDNSNMLINYLWIIEITLMRNYGLDFDLMG